MSIFRLLNLVRLQLRSASESIQPVLIIWVGLNSNEVRLMKSSASEPGLSHSSNWVSQRWSQTEPVAHESGHKESFDCISLF